MTNDEKVAQILRGAVKDIEGARDALQNILDRIQAGA